MRELLRDGEMGLPEQSSGEEREMRREREFSSRKRGRVAEGEKT